jgi:hypothetical protein
MLFSELLSLLFTQKRCPPIFQELFHFRIVIRLDLLVGEEVLLYACMFHELEAVAIESIFILISCDIMDNDAQGSVRADDSVCFPVFCLMLERNGLPPYLYSRVTHPT